jgi:uncharacterized protein (DUF362 family)
LEKRSTRREFLRTTIHGAGATAGLLLFPPGVACGGLPAKPRVVCVRDPKIRLEKGLDAAVAKAMVNRSVRLATGADSDAAGWKALFSSRDRVALKLNCLAAPRMSPTPEVVRAIVQGLLSAGVEAKRIILFERTKRELHRAGFTPERAPEGVRILATDMLPGGGYGRDPRQIVFSGKIGSFFSRVLTEQCDALINVGVLKDHNLSGVSVGLKNLYGLIHNPNKYHDGGCNPYVADVAAAPPVKDRLRLTICDAVTAQYDRGPAFSGSHVWKENAVFASIDPVALDHAAWLRIEEVRKKKDLPTLKGTAREPRWIRTAAKHKLGTDDPDRYRLIEV